MSSSFHSLILDAIHLKMCFFLIMCLQLMKSSFSIGEKKRKKSTCVFLELDNLPSSTFLKPNLYHKKTVLTAVWWCYNEINYKLVRPSWLSPTEVNWNKHFNQQWWIEKSLTCCMIMQDVIFYKTPPPKHWWPTLLIHQTCPRLITTFLVLRYQ